LKKLNPVATRNAYDRDKQMAIDRRSLMLGDILITTKDHLVSHCGIVAGYRDVRGPGGFSVPAAYPDIVYHATGNGMKKDDIAVWLSERGASGVFRMSGLKNVTVGGKDPRKLIADMAVQLFSRCYYSKARAYVLSWTATTDFGSGAKGRLAKYTDRLGNGATNMIPVFCSEYVILSYQLAAMGDTNAPFFIELDGKHCLPKDLRNWILQQTKPGGKWLYMGDLT
jgi:hypothetical protein